MREKKKKIRGKEGIQDSFSVAGFRKNTQINPECTVIRRV